MHLGIELMKERFDYARLSDFRQRLQASLRCEQGRPGGTGVWKAPDRSTMLALKVKAGIQRMDSTQISDIPGHEPVAALSGRRPTPVARIERSRTAGLRGRSRASTSEAGSGRYVYRVKGQEASAKHTQRVGRAIQRLSKGKPRRLMEKLRLTGCWNGYCGRISRSEKRAFRSSPMKKSGRVPPGISGRPGSHLPAKRAVDSRNTLPRSLRRNL